VIVPGSCPVARRPSSTRYRAMTPPGSPRRPSRQSLGSPAGAPSLICGRGKLCQPAAPLRPARRCAGQCASAIRAGATHGNPENANAPPPSSMGPALAVVQKRIIEKSPASCVEQLQARVFAFRSETDTDHPHLIAQAPWGADAAVELPAAGRCLEAVAGLRFTPPAGAYAHGCGLGRIALVSAGGHGVGTVSDRLG